MKLSKLEARKTFLLAKQRFDAGYEYISEFSTKGRVFVEMVAGHGETEETLKLLPSVSVPESKCRAIQLDDGQFIQVITLSIGVNAIKSMTWNVEHQAYILDSSLGELWVPPILTTSLLDPDSASSTLDVNVSEDNDDSLSYITNVTVPSQESLKMLLAAFNGTGYTLSNVEDTSHVEQPTTRESAKERAIKKFGADNFKVIKGNKNVH